MEQEAKERRQSQGAVTIKFGQRPCGSATMRTRSYTKARAWVGRFWAEGQYWKLSRGKRWSTRQFARTGMKTKWCLMILVNYPKPL